MWSKIFFKTNLRELFAVGPPRMYFNRPRHFCSEPIYFHTFLHEFLLFPRKRGKRRQGAQTWQKKGRALQEPTWELRVQLYILLGVWELKI